MGRSRKGMAISGWLVVDKPAGVGSTQVVAKVRWALGAQKAGHAGTLDPDATGVLAIALGEATKTVPYLAEALKCYRFQVTWGVETSTDDAAGVAIATSETRPSQAAIETALQAFRGQIAQVPPQVSAVHVDGERAYDLVRDGQVLDLAPRPLWVDSLELIEATPDHAVLEMVCGKGGYVRAIARDLGRALGCLGHVAWLRRLWSGPFSVDQAVTLDEVERLAKTDALLAHLHPLQAALCDLPELAATPEGAVRLRNGNPGMVLTSGLDWGTPAWASYQGRPLAVGHYRSGELHPARVFVPDPQD
jgi:tRNA pseudouridine55 synthase